VSEVKFDPIPPLEKIAPRLIDPVAEGPADILPGFLPRQGQLVIAGETNVGKSLLALEVCSALSTNRALWGTLEPTLKAKRILYVLGEHYVEVIQRLWAKTQLPMTDEVFILGPEQLGFDKWLVSGGKPNPVARDKFAKWTEGVDLIVFDPLSAFIIGGDGIENDNVQMRLVLDEMSGIAQRAGASCIVLAHQGKPMMDKTGQEHTRTKYAVRGASGIEDAATNIFYLSRANGESEAASKAAGSMILSLTCRKYKGEAPGEYRLLRDPATLTHTLLGNRPFIEVQKIDAQAKVARVQQHLPDLSFAEAIKAVAAIENKDERTIRRYLETK
jgi:RecA-family ATPase